MSELFFYLRNYMLITSMRPKIFLGDEELQFDTVIPFRRDRLVIKLLGGTQGVGVVLAKTQKAAKSVIEFMEKNANPHRTGTRIKR